MLTKECSLISLQLTTTKEKEHSNDRLKIRNYTKDASEIFTKGKKVFRRIN